MSKFKSKKSAKTSKYSKAGNFSKGNKFGKDGKFEKGTKFRKDEKPARDKKFDKGERSSKGTNQSKGGGSSNRYRSAKPRGSIKGRRAPILNEQDTDRIDEYTAATDPTIIYGKNSVLETLESGTEVNKLVVQQDSRDHTVQKTINICKERKIPIRFVDKSEFERTHRGLNHQGVLLYTAPYKYAELEDLVEIAHSAGEEPLLVILDSITDPHNLGAIIRTAHAVGAHGVIIPKRESATVTQTVVKTSSGAVQHIAVARVSNLVQAIQKLKRLGLWIVGADLGKKPIHETRMDGPVAVVIGSEGDGMGRLVRENCDILTSIPMVGKLGSLNASVAGGVILYEVFRQRGIH